MPDETSRPGLRGVIPDDYAGQRLDQALAGLFPQYSRACLQNWIKQGRVTLKGGVPEAKTRVWGGEQIRIEAPLERDEPAAAQAIPLDIVYEDDALIVIDKPSGLVVHPGSGVREGTLMNALLHHSADSVDLPRAGIVHRLDKDTSGLMVVARTHSSHTNLTRQLQARSVSRVYLALALGRAGREGRVVGAIGRHPSQRTRMTVTAGGRPAITHYETLRQGARWSLIRCRLETGRTHQIRVHLADLGHPLIGDPTYGHRGRETGLPSAAQGFARQALHATELELTHPFTGDRMRWRRDPPADFRDLLAALEAGDPPA